MSTRDRGLEALHALQRAGRLPGVETTLADINAKIAKVPPDTGKPHWARWEKNARVITDEADRLVTELTCFLGVRGRQFRESPHGQHITAQLDLARDILDMAADWEWEYPVSGL